jgi:hypothetical protein
VARRPKGDVYLVYKPCVVTLLDGTVLDRVYVQNATDYVNTWGVWPDDDQGKNAVDVSRVAHIASSLTRLPPRIAEAIYLRGETCKAGCGFTLVFSDSIRQECLASGAVDWVPYPPGKQPGDIVDVTFDYTGRNVLLGFDYAWCLYGFGKSRDPGHLRWEDA